MTKRETNIIFERYNSASDVIRCPYGRATVRNMVDLYARAAVNLYGLISREDFVDIFNKQNSEKTTVQEIYLLLLPLVLKQGYYCFYKEYIVHYSFFDNLNYVDYLLEDQEYKPRYIPEKDEFLKYSYEAYTDNDYWSEVSNFMYKAFGYSRSTSQGYQDIKDYITYGIGINELGPILERHNLTFQSEKQMQDFFNLLMNANNNTRIWQNKGYTPSELHRITMED